MASSQEHSYDRHVDSVRGLMELARLNLPDEQSVFRQSETNFVQLTTGVHGLRLQVQRQYLDNSFSPPRVFTETVLATSSGFLEVLKMERDSLRPGRIIRYAISSPEAFRRARKLITSETLP
jgi:hypothetical protein